MNEFFLKFELGKLKKECGKEKINNFISYKGAQLYNGNKLTAQIRILNERFVLSMYDDIHV